jgi:transcriptional regulator with XRE-family HTH domain
MIQIAFGKAVRFFREQIGISQEELAHRSGLHRTYLSDVERGERNIGLGNIHAIANGLGISLVDLFEETIKQLKAE